MSNASKNSVNDSSQKPLNKRDRGGSVNNEIKNTDESEMNNRLVKKPNKFFNPETSHYISQCSGLSMGLMGILKLKNILNYKDLRSVIQWCSKNEVFIIHQGNKQFVNKWEFILSFYKPFIKHLKGKHNNWKEVFLGYLNGDLGNLLASSKEEVQNSSSVTYKPKNKKEASFLNKIKKL